MITGHNRFDIGFHAYGEHMGKAPRVAVLLKIMSEYLKTL